MKSDLSIKQDVNDELLWEPAVDAAGVGVESTPPNALRVCAAWFRRSKCDCPAHTRTRMLPRRRAQLWNGIPACRPTGLKSWWRTDG